MTLRLSCRPSLPWFCFHQTLVPRPPVEVEHHLARAVACLLEAALVRLTQLNPEFNLIGIVLAPELGLVVGREPLVNSSRLGGMPGEGR